MKSVAFILLRNLSILPIEPYIAGDIFFTLLA